MATTKAAVKQIPQDEVVSLEHEILRLVDRKRRIDQQIAETEARIHALESDYLAETRPYGNIFTGLDGYLTTSTGRPVAGGSSAGGVASEVTIIPGVLERPFSSGNSAAFVESPRRVTARRK